MQLPMIFSHKKRAARRADRQAGATLYQCVLKGALDETIYLSGLGVDTFQGRFEQVALHGALVMRALREREQMGVARCLNEEIFAGFDHAYRQTGVGDSSISRKVRKLGERFYGLARGLDKALDDPKNKELEAFITRNGLAFGEHTRMISYLRSANKDLSTLAEVSKVEWPLP